MIVSDLSAVDSALPPFYHGMSNNEVFSKEQAPEARITLSVLSPGGMSDMHMHPESQHYFLMVEGVLLVKTDVTEVIIKPGQSVLIEKGEPHQVINPHNGITKYFAIGCPYPKEWKKVAFGG